MRWEISIPPTIEPVTLAEAKAHLRLTGTQEDDLLTNLIIVAREYAEYWLSRCLISQEISHWLNGWPQAHVSLPIGPALSLNAVSTFDQNDVETTHAIDTFYLQPGLAPRVFRKGISWPSASREADAINIRYLAGFGETAAEVPPAIRHGILLMTAHLFSERGDTPDRAMNISGAERLWRPYRVLKII